MSFRTSPAAAGRLRNLRGFTPSKRFLARQKTPDFEMTGEGKKRQIRNYKGTQMLKIMLTIITILTAATCIFMAVLGHNSRSGKAPGMTSGTLAPCPDKPNCVCSEFSEDTSHTIAPLDYSAISSEKAWDELLQVIQESGGEIVVSSENYLAATFSVSIFGFIDDVECRLDTSSNRIHIRSTSRVGRSDLGINKKRAETITRLFSQKLHEVL